MEATTSQIIYKLKELKSLSGTHSPSIATIMREIPELTIKVDACFLSNPYATDLFIEHMKGDILMDHDKFRAILEFYPPQNNDVAQIISKASGVSRKNIFAGNGAIEAIQAVMHRFAGKKVALPLPTFSSYYEYAVDGMEMAYFHLKKEDDFALDINEYLQFIHDSGADTAILINPNNPNGGYTPQEQLRHFISSLKHLEAVIIDESFVHFAYEDEQLNPLSIEPWVNEFPNLIVIKSMSKDFGIAGLRAGYAVMSEERVSQLLRNGYLWNVSGLTDYFFKLYAQEEFRQEYELVRKKYIQETSGFLKELSGIEGLKTYPSKANFALVELTNGMSSFDFCMNMLCYHQVYLRDCSDKAGLEGSFVRVASRSASENVIIVNAIRQTLGSGALYL